MAKVACFSLPGINCWFWSDDHDPPHFHAKRNGEWEVRVRFLEAKANMIEMHWVQKPISAADRKRIVQAVEQYRDGLLKQWEEVRHVS